MTAQHPTDSTPGVEYGFRFKYETFRALLTKNGKALQLMSDLEADLNHMQYFDPRIRKPIHRLLSRALLMAQELNLLTDNEHRQLYGVLFRLGDEVEAIFAPAEGELAVEAQPGPLLVPLTSKTEPDSGLVGGKAMGIWRLARAFEGLAPPAFVVTTEACRQLLQENNLRERIRMLLSNLDVIEDEALFHSRTETIRRLIRGATVGEELCRVIDDQAARFEAENGTRLWAVRSSAVCEDGAHSFAGQFDSELLVPRAELPRAFLTVLASRFTDRAVSYRAFHNFSEVETPMAVLFMPMVEAAAAGVLHSATPEAPDTMMISAVSGLADAMVKGEELSDSWKVTGEPLQVTARMVRGEQPALSDETVLELARRGRDAVVEFGHTLDIEWVVNPAGRLFFVQARPLNLAADAEEKRPQINRESQPLLEQGITVFPGRAEGLLFYLHAGDAPSIVPDGAIVLVEHSRLELAPLLPRIAALLIMEGNPVDHLSTLVREYAVPCIVDVGREAKFLAGREMVSVNATRRRIYDGIRWPGLGKRMQARLAAGNRHQRRSGPLYDRVLALNLIDPDGRSFKANSCRSIHDTLRFMHEMAVRSLFGFGDSRERQGGSRPLETTLPLKFQMIDLDHSLPPEAKSIAPKQVKSLPFQALWRGISDEHLQWPERWRQRMRGMPAEFQESVLGGNRGPRRKSARNYAMVAADYLNLNARFDYHYAMVDAMVGPGTDHNHVHFRFRGGGGNGENRIRRARFLERVLRQFGFGVDRSGDLVTAWYRRYPRHDSQAALEFLGRVLVCARQLDAILDNDRVIVDYADAFMNGEYNHFG